MECAGRGVGSASARKDMRCEPRRGVGVAGTGRRGVAMWNELRRLRRRAGGGDESTSMADEVVRVGGRHLSGKGEMEGAVEAAFGGG